MDYEFLQYIMQSQHFNIAIHRTIDCNVASKAGEVNWGFDFTSFQMEMWHVTICHMLSTIILFVFSVLTVSSNSLADSL